MAKIEPQPYILFFKRPNLKTVLSAYNGTCIQK